MKDIWNAIKSIFINDAHNIISKRGKEILAKQQHQREMNRIKHLRAQHSVSYDMIKELHNPEAAEEIIKREITLQLAKLLHEEFEMEFCEVENPYVGQAVKAEIVAMPVRDWNKIHIFLNQNHFKFSEL